ncbi:hypothetical protein [Adhaeribacter aquaticus]|nr:hypothetical protein [Adhaeribacter aquaticus]
MKKLLLFPLILPLCIVGPIAIVSVGIVVVVVYLADQAKFNE